MDDKIKLERHVQLLMDQDGMTRKEALEDIMYQKKFFQSSYIELAESELQKENNWNRIGKSFDEEGV